MLMKIIHQDTIIHYRPIAKSWNNFECKPNGGAE